MHVHYCDVIMGAMASQITSLTIVYSTVYLGADQRKHQSSASLAFVRGNSPVTGEFPTQMASNAEMFPFDEVIMEYSLCFVLFRLHEIWDIMFNYSLLNDRMLSVNRFYPGISIDIRYGIKFRVKCYLPKTPCCTMMRCYKHASAMHKHEKMAELYEIYWCILLFFITPLQPF